MKFHHGRPIPSMGASRYPYNHALVFEDIDESYQELEDHAKIVANALASFR